jgi:GH18 family chitinase
MSCNNGPGDSKPDDGSSDTLEVKEGLTVNPVPVPPVLEKTPCDELLEDMEKGISAFKKNKDRKALLGKFRGWSQSKHFNDCKGNSDYSEKFDKANAEMLEAIR